MSEFPETKFSKFSKKIGWIFSPVLLIILIIFTFFTAEGLKFDFKSGAIERKSSFEIKNIKDARVFINNQESDKTPNVYDVDKSEEFEVKLIKEGRKDWIKKVDPKPGYVRTYLPVMFPKDLDFGKKEINVYDIFTSTLSNFFFYEKIENDKILIYKYSVTSQLFGPSVKNTVFADITSLTRSLTQTPNSFQSTTNIFLKDFQIIPSNNGRALLVVINGERVSIIDERGNIQPLVNIVPKKGDLFTWIPNDSQIIYQTGNELYAIDLSINRLVVIHHPQKQGEIVEIQFLFDSGLVYTVEDDSSIDLAQNSYDGNTERRVDIPNIGKIRTKSSEKNTLLKAYNLIEKQSTILIETNENIYAYNTATSEIKRFDKLNRFKGERVIYIDPDKEVVVTVNGSNTNQFRYYDLDQPDQSKSFTLDGIEANTKPQKVLGYNDSQNLVLQYKDKIEFIDIDGANRITYTKFKDPQVIMTVRIDNSIHIAVRDSTTTPTLTKPTPTSSPTSSISPTPIQQVIDAAPSQRYKLRFEIFEN